MGRGGTGRGGQRARSNHEAAVPRVHTDRTAVRRTWDARCSPPPHPHTHTANRALATQLQMRVLWQLYDNTTDNIKKGSESVVVGINSRPGYNPTGSPGSNRAMPPRAAPKIATGAQSQCWVGLARAGAAAATSPCTDAPRPCASSRLGSLGKTCAQRGFNLAENLECF